MDDNADTDATAGHGCDQPPPVDRERRRDSGNDGDENVDSDAEQASTDRYLGWLKLWRVVLLVILALVRLIRAL